MHRGSASLVVALMSAACGSGGGGAGGSGGATGGLTGNLVLLEHWPSDGAVQVALDAAIELRFDNTVVEESLAEPDTLLAVDGSEVPLPGTYTRASGGRTLRFRPDHPLVAETDYVFQVSPLTTDTSGRILERAVMLRFRTLDQRGPAVVWSSVVDQATGVPRTTPILLQLDEAGDPESLTQQSVTLTDAWGLSHPTELQLTGRLLSVRPVVDLAGLRNYLLIVRDGGGALTDRAGNRLRESFRLQFKTEADTMAPVATRLWPGSGIPRSPFVQPRIDFSESIDPSSVGPSSVELRDEHDNRVALRAEPTADQRTLRLVPQAALVSGRRYVLELAGGPRALTDVSGNPLAQGAQTSFVAGSDATPPALVESLPQPAAARVSPNVQPELRFSEDLDPESVTGTTVHLTQDGVPLAFSAQCGGATLRVTPATLLVAGVGHRLTVRGGQHGVRDLAGNPLPADQTIDFVTSLDPTPPAVLLLPFDGATALPIGISTCAVFDAPLDPATVSAATAGVRGPSGDVGGQVTLERGGRVVRFTPAAPLQPGAAYVFTLRGGPQGVREVSGNWLADDATSAFRLGYASDLIAPTVRVTLNGIADARKAELCVPPHGFTFDVEAVDPVHYTLDPGAFELLLTGPAELPGPDALYVLATVTADGLSCRLPTERALPPGDYQLVARARDLSGNAGVSQPLVFRVLAPTADTLPFERTQVVWVRTDLDRDGNGRADFEDDLLALGFLNLHDNSGTNRRMLEVLRDGILAQANALLFRSAAGSQTGGDSVAVRLTGRRPAGVAHMQIACGGLDPEGARGRTYGNNSTGILGRAFYDYRNSAWNDLNIAQRPGLGVFPGEMFLYQSKLHLQVYPSYVTPFARRFLNLSPHMNGTPAGMHALDAVVLARGFDVGSATSEQRARYYAVFLAADDWAAAIGVILAHEIGHAVGLVAPGGNPRGLHGDSSLHNQDAGPTDVMASAVSYESLIALDYAFRDLNIAYLRQRVLVR
jgi:hypothetical protein